MKEQAKKLGLYAMAATALAVIVILAAPIVSASDGTDISRPTSSIRVKMGSAENMAIRGAPWLHGTWDHEKWKMEQEAIRDEIFYGELEPLVLLVHAEAGNQDFLGKQLVAEVVFNRIRSPRFPDTIEDVINQPGQFSTVRSLEKWAWGNKLIQSDYDAVLEAYFNPTNDRILYFDSLGGVNGRNHFKHGGHWFGE